MSEKTPIIIIIVHLFLFILFNMGKHCSNFSFWKPITNHPKKYSPTPLLFNLENPVRLNSTLSTQCCNSYVVLQKYNTKFWNIQTNVPILLWNKKWLLSGNQEHSSTVMISWVPRRIKSESFFTISGVCFIVVQVQGYWLMAMPICQNMQKGKLNTTPTSIEK